MRCWQDIFDAAGPNDISATTNHYMMQSCAHCRPQVLRCFANCITDPFSAANDIVSDLLPKHDRDSKQTMLCVPMQLAQQLLLHRPTPQHNREPHLQLERAIHHAKMGERATKTPHPRRCPACAPAQGMEALTVPVLFLRPNQVG